MIRYEEELNQEQLQVVMEGGGPLLVLAGAGSGKTRTLTYRVARLLERGIPAENILLATFTNKAARSMLNRVESILGCASGKILGGTFHHIANVILRSHAFRLCYKKNFTIIDAEDARQLIAACMSELKIDSKVSSFPKSNIIAEILSLSKNTQNSLADTVQKKAPFFLHLLEDFISIASLYTQKKQATGVMDFDDLLCNCRALLLERPDLQKQISERFEHILVDEYQDTNTIQAELIDLLASAHRNIMVVGDDSQSIYSFRGADLNNIINFPKRYRDCKIFKLETNYRSTPEILHLANMSITNNENQYPKELRPVRNKGTKPVMVSAHNALKQADFVAQRIKELSSSGMPLNEIAVLYRAHYHSMEVQMELVRRDIPFDIRSGLRFFEQAHIKDVTSYMRILVNPRDELAWRRILIKYSGIGRATLEKLWRHLAKNESPLMAIFGEEFVKITPKQAGAGMDNCRQTINSLIHLPEHDRTPQSVIAVLLGTSCYQKYLRENYSDAVSREEDLIQLGNFSTRFDSMENFLNEMALLTNMTREDDLEANQYSNKVVLSTIHQAKGMEWSYVFLIWCADGMIPLWRALKEPGGEEEERRLFYVAVTRTKDQLYLTYPIIDYTRTAGALTLSPSRFIREIAPLSVKDELHPFDQWTLYDEY